MANLGINIRVDFAEANKQIDAFVDKWKQIGKEPVKVKIDIDTKKIDNLKETVSKISKGDKGIKLKVDTSAATNSLKTFRDKFNSLRQDIEKGLDIKIGSNSVDSKGMDSVLKNSTNLTNSLKAANSVSEEMARSYKDMDSYAQKFARTNLEGAEQAKSGYDKLARSKMDSSKQSEVSARNEMAALKEMARLTKEIGNIESQSVGKPSSQQEIMTKRIADLRTELNGYKADYEKAFGSSADNNWIIKKSQDLAEYNLKMKEAAHAVQEKAAEDKKTEGFVKNLMKYENQRFSLLQKADATGGQEAAALREQADMIMLKVMRMREYNSEANMTSKQKNQISDLMKENELIGKMTNARKQDKQAFEAVKSSQKEMFALQKQMSKYEAQEENRSIDSKGRQRLNELQQEYDMAQKIYNAQKKQATDKGTLTGNYSEQLRLMKTAHDEQMKMVQASSKAQANTKLQTQEYGRLKDSINRVNQLNDQLSNSGKNQGREIKAVIDGEKQKQAAIKDTIRVKKLANDEYDKEIRQAQKTQDEATLQSERIAKGKRLDSNEYSGVLATAFDPRRVYQEGKQAAMIMYESVATLDKQFTDIAKVADVPQETLDTFSKDIFQQASAVGKSADAYAESVARWLVTGKTFKESQDLSQVSVMGGFVGNIDEESMVKYMSVPLQNFKKDMIDAKDIINAMNEVSNNNAIEMNDLGEAYSRASQTASTAGTTFSQLTGLITGANIQTRAGGEKIGTALKAIDLNFNKMSTGVTKADGERSSFFQGLGIDLKGADGQLRSTYDILGDLSKVWDNLSSDDKGLATMYAAGKNHAPVLQGLMTGWDDVVKSTQEAEQQVGLINKESGSAYKEFGKQQESVEYKAVQLKNSWTELLNTIAGGRDGVNGVLEIMTQILDKGNEFAGNDKFMKIAGTVGKLAATLTGVLGAKKVFGAFSGAIGDIGLAIAKIMSPLSKLGKFSMFAGLGKVGGVISGVGGAIGSLIPIVGGVIAALTLMDAMGVPVWETLGKAVKWTADQFESAESKAKKANKAFIDDQEKVAKSLDDNKLLNGTIEQSEDLFKSYEALKEAKKKAFEETGNKNAFSYTDDEFAKLKENFDATAESLGIDIELTMNDYGDIEAKMEKLLKYKQRLSAESLQDGIDDFDKSAKPKDLDKDEDSWNDKVRRQKEKITQEKLSLQDLENMYDRGETTKAVVDNSKKIIDQYEEELDAISNFYTSKEALEAKEADRSRFNNLRQYKEKLGNQAEKGLLQDSWGSLEKGDQEKNLTVLAAQGRALQSNTKYYERYKNEVQSALDLMNSGSQENAVVSEKTLEEIKKLSPEYANLSTNVTQWGDRAGTIMAQLNEATEKSAERTNNLKNNMKELAASTGWDDGKVNAMNQAIDEGGAKFVQFMASMGEAGAAMMNVGTLFMHKFGDDWGSQLTQIQSQVDSFSQQDIDKAINLKLVNEDGIVNGEMMDSLLQIPDEVQTKFKVIDESGDINLQNTMTLLEQLQNADFDSNFKAAITVDGQVNLDAFLTKLNEADEKSRNEILAKLGIQVEGEDKADKAKQAVEAVDGKTANAKVNVNAEGVDEADKAKKAVEATDGKTANAKVSVKGEGLDVVTGAEQKIDNFNGKEGTGHVKASDETGGTVATAKSRVEGFSIIQGIGKLDANKAPLEGKVAGARGDVAVVNGLTGTSRFFGDSTSFDSTSAHVKSESKDTSSTHTFTALLSGAWDMVKQFFSGGSSSISIEPPASALAQSQKNKAESEKKKSKSVGIIDRNMGKSFSKSIAESVGSTTNKAKRGKSSSTSVDSDKVINADVWRYWGKELFKGLPLERSMENLENTIRKADDNYAKLIPLYKQQTNLLNQQIAYQKSLQQSKQSELSETLGKLRGKGFKTSGNKVTNLERAKAFKGDDATKVEEMLNKWKELYEGLDTITGKISSLNQEKWDVEQDIKEAQKGQEAKKIEDSLKKTEALLTAIESHTSILSKKEEFVSDKDSELKLTVQEESSNEAKRNIGLLADEFNRLSKMNIQYSENADDVKDRMENLKSQILENADAIISYRESMSQIRIDRLIEDYEKFSDVIEKNNDMLNDNIDILKEGLLSGTTFSDLQSSKLSNLTFNRKNQLDKQYQERLQLEAQLDSALNAFAKKNVDRAKNIANSQLEIEKKKYNELLKMQKEYSNGKTPSFNKVNSNFDIGAIKTEDSKANKTYQDWLNKLKLANSDYLKDFSALRDQYDKSISKATTQAERDSLTNNLIVDQMKLQEKIQRRIITLNGEAIAQARQELKNAYLTTEQREQLEQAISDYEESTAEAQQSIRDIIKDRFDFEFDLMDKASDKASNYSDKLEDLLNIAEAVNNKPSQKQDLIDKIYEAKANEYLKAKQALSQLLQEQSKFTEGSFEWNILQEKIESVDKSMRDLTVSMLEANKKVLGNKLEVLGDSLAKGALDGKTLDAWKDYQDRWSTGIEKEIELEKIRQRMLDIESDVNKERLEVLDRQEAVSKKELEYLDKQTKVLELQDKINNLDKERSVQTLIKKDDGTWDWDYVADQSEVDKAKEDLDTAEKDLEAFKNEQREKYVSDVQKVLDKAKGGGYESVDELKKELDDLRAAYGGILKDIPNMSMGSIEEILAAYEAYLKENAQIVSDATGGDKNFEAKLEKIGGVFENSFKAIAEDLGKIIGDALSEALGAVTGVKRLSAAQSYTIEHQELVFPNVEDTTGFEQVLIDLPQTAQQQIYSK
ncbi:phage tail tape measure protein [Enterococcus mundtii]|uniref:phage tail tape measure protein n=1 Tax=Enterococcus mundtii TaxID=53346 RepID=UPI001A965ACB|nr:phage tail tape measure protein [Enterococcus mundtii]MBO1087237.1 hypothetical protein [Enterococcus mundtii]